MGKGQVAAALSNFKSLAAIFGPPIAARIYTYGLSVGNPGIACKCTTLLYRQLGRLIHRN